eukprot:gb/GECH01005818.1/.p1 GENE.gb/GECH01005818.1/~~gb/GECH01005818.1/.p1  ORF type:complete len:684 (+),score=190.60 gb/GECH01005818.1/:1-2052(+)
MNEQQQLNNLSSDPVKSGAIFKMQVNGRSTFQNVNNNTNINCIKNSKVYSKVPHHYEYNPFQSADSVSLQFNSLTNSSPLPESVSRRLNSNSNHFQLNNCIQNSTTPNSNNNSNNVSSIKNNLSSSTHKEYDQTDIILPTPGQSTEKEQVIINSEDHPSELIPQRLNFNNSKYSIDDSLFSSGMNNQQSNAPSSNNQNYNECYQNYKKVCLSEWSIVFKQSKDGHFGLCVEGFRNQDDQFSYISSEIVERLSNFSVKSRNETIFQLEGNMHAEEMDTSELPRDIVEAFIEGFPPNWKKFVDMFSRYIDHTSSQPYVQSASQAKEFNIPDPDFEDLETNMACDHEQTDTGSDYEEQSTPKRTPIRHRSKTVPNTPSITSPKCVNNLLSQFEDESEDLLQTQEQVTTNHVNNSPQNNAADNFHQLPPISPNLLNDNQSSQPLSPIESTSTHNINDSQNVNNTTDNQTKPPTSNSKNKTNQKRKKKRKIGTESSDEEYIPSDTAFEEKDEYFSDVSDAPQPKKKESKPKNRKTKRKLKKKKQTKQPKKQSVQKKPPSEKISNESPAGVRVTRSGRVSVPPLAYWSHQKIRRDEENGIVSIEPGTVDYTPQSKPLETQGQEDQSDEEADTISALFKRKDRSVCRELFPESQKHNTLTGIKRTASPQQNDLEGQPPTKKPHTPQTNVD